MKRPVLLSFAAFALSACIGHVEDSDASSEEVTATSYVRALDYWKAPADQNAWGAMLKKIDGEFNNVCGDTFCGGDYSNLTSLGLDCSVTSARGSLHECVWSFTGSSTLVNGGTGTVEASVASFQCRVAPKTSARALLTLLGATDAASAGNPSIRRVLPGTTVTLYDVLGDCFQHPIGDTPISQGTGTTYSLAPDSPAVDQDAYFSAEQTLQGNFNDVCGDTFCEGDYSNLQALRLSCSVRATTGTLRSCKWLFGGSYNDLDSKTGAITVHPKAAKCTLPVTGTANALTTFLLAPGATPAIQRVLPGSTKSAYDDLANCL